MGDDGAHNVNDVAGGEIVAWSEEGFGGGKKASLQLPLAFYAQLDARGGMDTVVDAVVQRLPAAETLSISCIDDGIDR